ncbi:MAG: PHP domain-containing protein [Phycisphaerae bacterium]|nr:PHP domain-containing protein [Phycisphaerae bacterium]
MGLVKTVFHIHTDYSDDSNLSVDCLADEAVERGVGCVAVTDHDSIEGAIGLAETAGDDLRVIVGEEVSTRDGHLIGLFLRDLVEPGMSVRQTAEAIRQQGGLVVVPHPYNRLFDCSLGDRVYDILDLIDAVEVANAQNLSPLPNRRSARFARRHGFPAVVGTDVHHRGYLDTCYQMMPDFEGPSEFVTSLEHARLHARAHPLSYFFRTAWLIAGYKLGLPLPAGYGANAANVPARASARQTVLSAE